MKYLSERIPQVEALQCVICGKRYSLDDVMYTCPDCGQVGTLDVVLKADFLGAGRGDFARRKNLWEEERFLPLAIDMPKLTRTIPLQIGDTPLYFAQDRPFAVKDDGKNPTASFKDRAGAMVVHHA